MLQLFVVIVVEVVAAAANHLEVEVHCLRMLDIEGRVLDLVYIILEARGRRTLDVEDLALDTAYFDLLDRIQDFLMNPRLSSQSRSKVRLSRRS